MEVDETASNDTPDEDGDNVTPEAETDADGWIEVTRRKKKREARRDDEPSPQRETQMRGRKGGIVKKILRTSKMPRLPKGNIKVIMRPRNRLNLRTAGGVALDETIRRTADINADETITICPNYTQNILVASTPDQETAGKLAKIRSEWGTRNTRSVRMSLRRKKWSRES
ncbi:hypothetical protein HPB52_002688 [Rhipicephalus sanguineus]|uniref:Uncharacterized protein n=1 Tax=Rhipicephalus sanguineus TaxID=34632 RepID=A0A9D4T6M5_RHISA|nr:hypothetical protein HPB52_002688 [Rhipicephalus sanguineus]